MGVLETYLLKKRIVLSKLILPFASKEITLLALTHKAMKRYKKVIIFHPYSKSPHCAFHSINFVTSLLAAQLPYNLMLLCLAHYDYPCLETSM